MRRARSIWMRDAGFLRECEAQDAAVRGGGHLRPDFIILQGHRVVAGLRDFVFLEYEDR